MTSKGQLALHLEQHSCHESVYWSSNRATKKPSNTKDKQRNISSGKKMHRSRRKNDKKRNSIGNLDLNEGPTIAKSSANVPKICYKKEVTKKWNSLGNFDVSAASTNTEDGTREINKSKLRSGSDGNNKWNSWGETPISLTPCSRSHSNLGSKIINLAPRSRSRSGSRSHLGAADPTNNNCGDSSQHSPHEINVALTEYLTCSYNNCGEMTACKVDGEVQIQNKGGMPDIEVPFQMRLRDKRDQLCALHENQKHVENLSNAAKHFCKSEQIKLFKIFPPAKNVYFPALRYECSQRLRPNPLRVKTHVRAENNQCHVAIEVVSNPFIKGIFQDIELFMGADKWMIGRNVVTQPVGGVWNAATRSVIWRVAKMGCGEKFKLLAKFNMEPGSPYSSANIPKIPVLLRCQCMQAQLSDTELELDLCDMPYLFPKGIKFKVAKRFRVAHQYLS